MISLLGLDVTDVHEGRGVADVPVRLVVLLPEHFEDALVAADHGVRALTGQIDDLWGALLPVAVHPAVPLREDHERPRHVEVDEPVAGEVEVDPLGGDVRADQQAHRRLRLTEGFHHPLLLHVGHRAVEGGELADAEAEVARQALPQPAEGLDPLGENDEPVLRVGGAPTERLVAVDGREEGPVLGELAGPDAFHGLVEGAEGLHLGGDGWGFAAVPFALPARETRLDGGAAGRRAGKQRLLQGDEEEVAAGGAGRRAEQSARAARTSRHPHPQQRLIGRLLGGGGRDPAMDDLPVAEDALHLVLDVLLEAADDEALPAEVLRFVVVRVGDGGGVQHVHQAGEAARPAVVRGRRQHDEGVRAARQQAGEPAAERARAAVGHVVRLVNDDHVPIGLLQVGPVLGVLLQGVNRDDGFVVVVEGVVVRGDAAADALDADGVEAGERDREAVPELLLELGQHALDGEDEDPPAPAAGDQLADQHSRFEGLAEPHRVGDEDALARLAKRLAGGLQLVANGIHGGGVADVEPFVARRGLPQVAFHEEQAVGEAGRAVADQGRFRGVQHLDLRLQLGEEDGLPFADEFGHADAEELLAAGRRGVHAADHPLGVPDEDTGAGREGDLGWWGRGLVHASE